MKQNLKYKNFLANLLFFTATVGFADSTLIYNNFVSIGFADSKNSIMGGATTATAKGYSALSSNPAGLATNHNITIYARSVSVEVKDSNSNTIKEFDPGNQIAGGILYDFIGLEYKVDDYILGGIGYGLETNYGLFSLGVSYLSDITDVTKPDETGDNDFATGDYMTVGFAWQKTFLSSDDFYTVYFGISQKASGEYTGNKKNNLEIISAKKLSYGLGLETNLGSTSILVTVDKYTKDFKSTPVSLDGLSYGIKWMLLEKLSVAGGMGSETYSSAATLDSVDFYGGGVEFGFWKFHMNVSYMNRDIKSTTAENDLTEESLHLDVSMVF